MKNFFKKVNRGLLLGAIIFVGFIAFVITDTINFKKNKPQIEASVCDFTNALADCAVTAPSKEDFQKKIENVILNYWCSGNGSGNDEYYYGVKMNAYRSLLENAAEGIFKNETAKVTKWNANPHDFYIVKSGPGTASVDFSCDITAEFNGNPYLITPSEIMQISDYIYYDDDHNMLESNTGNTQKISLSIDYQLKMRQIDGKWKICQSQSWGWSEPSITFVDEAKGGVQ